jgi:hypothetical protein
MRRWRLMLVGRLMFVMAGVARRRGRRLLAERHDDRRHPLQGQPEQDQDQ